MAYISPRGFRRGLGLGVQVGLAGRRERAREKELEARQDYEDSVREAALEREQEQARAAAEAAEAGLQETERREVGREARRGVQEALGEAGGVGPLGITPRGLARGMAGASALEQRFQRIKEVGEKLDPKFRPQFYAEQREAMRQEAYRRARRRVIDQMQDRMATGAYVIEGDNEVSPQIESRVQALVEGLESDQIDPVQASQVETQILQMVQQAGQQRLLKERGNKAIDTELERARESADRQYAESLEFLKTGWNTGQLDYDDLVDRMFEAKHGRRTARAAGPTPQELRVQAIELARDVEGVVNEETVERFLRLLVGPQQAAGQAGGPMSQAMFPPQVMAGGEAGHGWRFAEEVPRGTSAAEAGQEPTNGAPQEGGGRGLQGFKELPKTRRKAVEARLAEAMRKGEDIAAVARGLDLDIESLPRDVEKRLIAAGKGS